MIGDCLMIKRQPLMTYDRDGVSFKHSRYLLDVSYWTCIRWKQCHYENQLVIPHGLKGKIGNKTSAINYQTIMGEALDAPKFLLRTHGKDAPSSCNYGVQSKLQTTCLWSTLKRSWKAIWSHLHELEGKPKKLIANCEEQPLSMCLSTNLKHTWGWWLLSIKKLFWKTMS